MGEDPTYGIPVDVYSLSIMLYELFSGLEPFPKYKLIQLAKALEKNIRPPIPDNFPRGNKWISVFYRVCLSMV